MDTPYFTANGMNVFLFFEDWEQGTTHWTSAGGLDPANTGTMGLSVIASEETLLRANAEAKEDPFAIERI